MCGEFVDRDDYDKRIKMREKDTRYLKALAEEELNHGIRK